MGCVTGSIAQFTLNNGADDVTREYVVSANDKLQELGHTNCDVSVDLKTYSQRGQIAFLKVIKDMWESASTWTRGTTKGNLLAGAVFTLTRMNGAEDVASGLSSYTGAFLESDGTKYKTVSANEAQKTSVLTDSNGIATLGNLVDGVYEGKESAAPTGYLFVGDSTLYLKIDNGAVVFLQKQAGVRPKDWLAVPSGYEPAANSNVMSYTEAAPAVVADPDQGIEAREAVPATATVGNVAGPELPSTGGPGLWPLMTAGTLLFLASVATLALDRRH